MPRENMNDPINVASTRDGATSAKTGFATTGPIKEQGVRYNAESAARNMGRFLGSGHEFATKPENEVIEGIRSGNNRPNDASLNQQFNANPNYPSNKSSNYDFDKSKGQESKENMCSYESKQYLECLNYHGNSQKWCQGDYDTLKQCQRKYEQ